MDPQKAALHFTKAFHGDVRRRLFQMVESVPMMICTQDMVDRHGFGHLCISRPCNMFLGRLRLLPDEREEIYSGLSGLSALLDIGDHRLTHGHAASSTDPPQEPPQTAQPSDEEMSVVQRNLERQRIPACQDPRCQSRPDVTVLLATQVPTHAQNKHCCAWFPLKMPVNFVKPFRGKPAGTLLTVQCKPRITWSFPLGFWTPRITRSTVPRVIALSSMPHSWIPGNSGHFSSLG